MGLFFTEDLELNVILTDQAEWAQDEEPSWKMAREVQYFLEEEPGNAVIIHGGRDSFFGGIDYDPPIYILRGAGEDLSNFYYGEMPAENPNDADGGDLTAEEAIGASIGEYYE